MTATVAPEPDYFRSAEREVRSAELQTAPDASITPSRVMQSVRMRWNPIRNLNAERLISYLDQWRLGFFRLAGMTWDLMERRDYQLQIAAPKRKKAVARHGYDILTVEELEEGQQELAGAQQAFLKAFYENISVTTALDPDEQGGFSLLVRQMMDAIGKKYAVHEIVWVPGTPSAPVLRRGTATEGGEVGVRSAESGSQLSTLNPQLSAKFIFCPIWWFEGTRGKLRFLESEFQVYGKDMLPGDWLVTVHDGIMEACSICYLFKSLPMRSWIGFLDKFGTPGVLGKTDAQKGSPDWNDFVQTVSQFSQDWSAVTNTTGNISLVECKNPGAGEGQFGALIEKMDRAITQLWRGGDLGTSSKAQGTGATLQQDESEILETDDARIAEETLNAQVTKHALAWKFGPDAPQLAYLKLRTTPQQDIANDLAIDQFLVTNGGRLPLRQTFERYNRSVAKDDEATLAATAAAKPTQ